MNPKRYYILTHIDSWKQESGTGIFLTLEDAKAQSCRDERVVLVEEGLTERHQVEVWRNHG